MVVIWSEDAIKDLREYSLNSKIITEGKVEKYINDLVDFVDSLSANPHLGRLYYQYKKVAINQLVFKMHKIFYYVLNDEIIVIKVSHHRQNIDNVLNLIKEYINSLNNK